ncbi:response regulator transcription factor [Jiangella asiatica]|uniref:Response regulator transcription factor n=1 Tax=Jiangella asiatica TaxID=2530372 RepID=A0A4R5DH44_9ACTN|nr:response regulator transcription factor [Jiangella asiatica]
MRVIIAEDHYLVREGTRRLLEDGADIDVVASVGTAVELLDSVRRLRPDAVITDIRMPPDHRMEGIEAAHAIRSSHPETGVVVLSQHSDSAYAMELLRHGSAGLAYLLKSRVSNVDHITFALREVMAGRSVIDALVVEGLVERRRRADQSPVAQLGDRELQILRQMAEGRNNHGIAETLHLSLSSVEKYVTAIFVKLGLDQQPHVDRRIMAVLTYLRDTDQHP